MRLRNSLLRWLLIPLILIWAVDFRISYLRSRDQANEAYDRTLLGSALVIGERLTLVDGDVVADLPQAALEMLRTDAQDRIFYRVADLRDGRYITGYEDLPTPNGAPPTTEPVFYDAAKRALVETYRRRSAIGLVGSRINVETGEWVGKTSHISGGIDSYYEYLWDDQQSASLRVRG